MSFNPTTLVSICNKNIQNFLNKYLAKGTQVVSCGSHCISKETESAEIVAIFHRATPVCRSPLARLSLRACRSNRKFNKHIILDYHIVQNSGRVKIWRTNHFRILVTKIGQVYHKLLWRIWNSVG